MQTEKIILGGGCFWCIEAIFSHLKGVKSAISGYAGGDKEDANYRAVCTKQTGHVEVVEVTFDPAIITLETILKVYLDSHDPTSMDRQGADAGPQYRSVIFYTSENQKQVAEKIIQDSNQNYDSDIVTHVLELKEFFTAEKYHQKYYDNNPTNGYCLAVIGPKVQKIKTKYADIWE